MFGTFSHPDRHPLGALGIEDSPVPSGFLAQLALAHLAVRFARHEQPFGGRALEERDRQRPAEHREQVRAVGALADVNGDGHGDFAVGAPFEDTAGAEAGRPFAAAWIVDAGLVVAADRAAIEGLEAVAEVARPSTT